jgi:UDP-N-acetylglucosamine acyltransferase
MGNVHPTAIVDESVKLGTDVTIGPYCVVTGNVMLGDGVTLESHVVVTGNTTIGAQTHIYPFASIGHIPQDLKFGDEEVSLTIGARNRIREHVTMNPGTQGGGAVTEVGNDGLFMMGSHVAHDCIVGDNVILANNATLGGHVSVGDFAILGGLVGVHQFCRIGAHAFIGAGSLVVEDVIPFGAATGNRAVLSGLNLVGLKRRNFDRADINALRALHKALFIESEGALMARLANAAKDYGDSPCVKQVVEFMRVEHNRGYCTPRNK